MASYPHEDFASVGELHDALLAWSAKLRIARGNTAVPESLQHELSDAPGSVYDVVTGAASLMADDDRAPTDAEKALYRSSAETYVAFLDLINVTAANAAEQNYSAATDAAIRDLQTQLDDRGPLDKLTDFLDRLVQSIGQAAGITMVLALAVGAVLLYLMFRRKAAA